jgi:hypothetical protein
MDRSWGSWPSPKDLRGPDVQARLSRHNEDPLRRTPVASVMAVVSGLTRQFDEQPGRAQLFFAPALIHEAIMSI